MTDSVLSVVAQNDKPEAQETNALLAMAVEKGANIDTLERLMALRKEMLAEKAKEEFNNAMALFQSECPIIEKRKEVTTNTGKVAYTYAPIEVIVEQVKVLLQKHGFRYMVSMQYDGITVKATCKVVHAAGHEELSDFEVPLGNKTNVMSNSQVVAAASTFAKRYAFLNAFGIMTGDEDNDGANIVPADEVAPAAPAPQPTGKPITVAQKTKVKADLRKLLELEQKDPAQEGKIIYATLKKYYNKEAPVKIHGNIDAMLGMLNTQEASDFINKLNQKMDALLKGDEKKTKNVETTPATKPPPAPTVQRTEEEEREHLIQQALAIQTEIQKDAGNFKYIDLIKELFPTKLAMSQLTTWEMKKVIHTMLQMLPKDGKFQASEIIPDFSEHQTF